MTGHERIAFALDVASLSEAAPLLDALEGRVGVIKVGLELFVAEGPRAIRAVHDRGFDCFLDLKLHDIPATVASAARAASDHGAKYLTVHAASGPAALRAVARTLESTSTRALVVTVLTSLDREALEAIGVHADPAHAVDARVDLARAAELDGFVCAPTEARRVRERIGPSGFIVTPGVRPVGTEPGDQRRTATPAEAIAAGADLVVVGRPIRLAPDPAAAADAIAREIASL